MPPQTIELLKNKDGVWTLDLSQLAALAPSAKDGYPQPHEAELTMRAIPFADALWGGLYATAIAEVSDGLLSGGLLQMGQTGLGPLFPALAKVGGGWLAMRYGPKAWRPAARTAIMFLIYDGFRQVVPADQTIRQLVSPLTGMLGFGQPAQAAAQVARQRQLLAAGNRGARGPTTQMALNRYALAGV